MTSQNIQQQFEYPSLFSPRLNFNNYPLFDQNLIQSNNSNGIQFSTATDISQQLVDPSTEVNHNCNNVAVITNTPSHHPTVSSVPENTTAALGVAKEEAINNLWNNFQRVATNLSHLVSEERKRVSHEDQEDFLQLWPLFHDTASSLTSFYEEAISVFARGLEFGIEHGRNLEKKEQCVKIKKSKSKSKREVLFDKLTPQQTDACLFSSDEQILNPTNPSAKFPTTQPSPCPNCGYSIQKLQSKPQTYSIDNGQMVESNRKRNNLSFEEIPMETSNPKKAKFL